MYSEEEMKKQAESIGTRLGQYTIGTFIQDPRLPMILATVVKRINSIREKARSKSEKGLKRSPWEHLIDNGIISRLISEVSTEDLTKAGVRFIEEYILIIKKESKLPSNQRSTIEYVISEAYQELVKDDKRRRVKAKEAEANAKVDDTKINKKPRARKPKKDESQEPKG